jgi:hypothetical protein
LYDGYNFEGCVLYVTKYIEEDDKYKCLENENIYLCKEWKN